MSVLEAPQTWIAAAAVLVVVAVVLIALAPRRRRNAVVGSAGAAGTAAAPSSSADDDAVTTPVGPMAASLDTSATGEGPDGTSRRTGDWFRSEVPEVAEGSGASDLPQRDERGPEPAGAHDEDATGETVPVADPAPTSGPVPTPAAAPAPAPAAEDVRPAPVRPTPRYVAVSDPARAGERAKDRLLAALLADPDGAVDVVTAMSEDGEASGTAAASLLRAGLTPAQVAGLCGFDEAELATLIARDLGLLARSQRDQDGRSRTEDPGRAWASAGSASVSTTPTTG